MNYKRLSYIFLLSMITTVFSVHKPLLIPDKNTLQQLQEHNLYHADVPLRLHLGCGENHFEGYINIDFPSSHHTVQTNRAADCFADITSLEFPQQTVCEVRLHHLFEHFDRASALALLAAWSYWLTPGGTLIIETPDFAQSIQLLMNSSLTYREKEIIIRHLYGSHEAEWAFHRDGWYKEKYQKMLSELGFEIEKIQQIGGLLKNIIVIARKKISLCPTDLCFIAQRLLTNSMVDESPGERQLLNVWYQDFIKKFYRMINSDTKI